MPKRPKPRNWDEDPDSPLTEEEWLAEFQESDVRSARFGELLETLMDHPDRDRLIAKEMGWDDLAESLEAGGGKGSDRPDELAEERDPLDDPADFAAADAGGADDDLDAEESFQQEEDELDRAAGLEPLSGDPAYEKAFALATFVIKLARPLEKYKFQDPRHGELFGEAIGNALIPAAKIRGGHSFGYDEQICGNIVKNRFALVAADKCERALLELRAAAVIPADFIDQVLPRVREVKQLIEERIADMRKRVWWGK